MSSVRAVLSEQITANRSSAACRAAFAGHRARLTELVVRDAARESGLTLCVLGAGNVNDLELEELATRYRTIHLVDLDAEALAGAVARETPATQARLVCHAPVDVSGMLPHIERWAGLRVTPEELALHAESVANRLSLQLGGPFDVVLSSCLLTQMQLGVLTVLGEAHPLFEAVRFTLTLSHLRSLSQLTTRGGRTLLVSDLTADDIAPEIMSASPEELALSLETLVAGGRVFQVAQPELLRQMVNEDPILAAELDLPPPVAAWRWHNGRERTFLVVAFDGRRKQTPRVLGAAGLTAR
jgi:hypothetical protein